MIAVDAMGGDYAPHEIVLGALLAAKRGVRLTLFGNQDKVIPLLVHHCPRWRYLGIDVVHCSETINMDEDPLRGILRKKDASLIQALHAVSAGDAHAFVSAGNSGAVVAAATVILGRVPGIVRPAIASFLPSLTDSFLCLDLGANPDCKPENLVQCAYMGHAYVRIMKEIAQPRIALLSNGHEAYKGSTLVKDAFDLISQTNLNFIGNIESRDIFSGNVDVVVTDGFTGNILLKGIQGTAKTIMGWLQQEASQSLLSKLALTVAYPVLSRIKMKFDYSRVGGAPLLGINGSVVMAHGSSKEDAIAHAILSAATIVEQHTMSAFNDTLRALLEKHEIQRSHVKKSVQSHIQL